MNIFSWFAGASSICVFWSCSALSSLGHRSIVPKNDIIFFLTTTIRALIMNLRWEKCGLSFFQSGAGRDSLFPVPTISADVSACIKLWLFSPETAKWIVFVSLPHMLLIYAAGLNCGKLWTAFIWGENQSTLWAVWLAWSMDCFPRRL